MTSPDTLEAAARTAADKAHAARKAADRAAGYADLARGTEHFARAEAIARQADDDAVAAEREAKRTADRADAARIEVDRAALHNSAHYQAEMARMLD